jgi:hypothetical protein
MVSMAPENVGEHLTTVTNGAVSKEVCEAIFSTVSSSAQWFLFGAVMHSLYMYCQICELNGTAEAAVWSGA